MAKARSDSPQPVLPGVSTGVTAPPVLPPPLQVSVPDVPTTPAFTVPSVDTGLSLPAIGLPDVQVTLPPLPPKLP